MRLDIENQTSKIVRMKDVEEIRKCSGVIIFGAGESGTWVKNVLMHNGIDVKCYCDNSNNKIGKYKDNILIEKFETAILKYPEAAICLASMWGQDIKKQITETDANLLKRTWNLLTTMNWETMKLDYESEEEKYIQKNMSDFKKLYKNLDDELSKRTLEGILNYRLTRNEKYLEKIICKNEEYIDNSIITDEIRNSILGKSIIDGGAFDGDTAESFLSYFNNKIRIHCYEPDNSNVNSICRKKKEKGIKQLIVHQAALWDCAHMQISFEGDGLSGRIVKSDEDMGRTKILVQTEVIDDLRMESVMLIKLDIEGAERKALEGGRNLIEQYHPVLAICAYHLQDDLLVLSEFINSLHWDYKIYLRHYMLSSGDTIMYGIPSM